MSSKTDLQADAIGHVRTHETCTPDCPVWRAKLALIVDSERSQPINARSTW